MISLCNGIAGWCRKNGAVSEENYPIVLYGIQVLLNSSLKVAGILLTGVMLNRFVEVLISTAVFCSMRRWTGGWHSNSHLGCFGTMLVPCVCPSLLMGIDWQWGSLVLECMIIYSAYRVLKYAPRNSEVNPIEDVKDLQRKRVGGIVEMAGLLLGVMLCPDLKVQWLLVFPLFVNAVLLTYKSH